MNQETLRKMYVLFFICVAMLNCAFGLRLEMVDEPSISQYTAAFMLSNLVWDEDDLFLKPPQEWWQDELVEEMFYRSIDESRFPYSGWWNDLTQRNSALRIFNRIREDESIEDREKWQACKMTHGKHVSSECLRYLARLLKKYGNSKMPLDSRENDAYQLEAFIIILNLWKQIDPDILLEFLRYCDEEWIKLEILKRLSPAVREKHSEVILGVFEKIPIEKKMKFLRNLDDQFREKHADRFFDIIKDTEVYKQCENWNDWRHPDCLNLLPPRYIDKFSKPIINLCMKIREESPRVSRPSNWCYLNYMLEKMDIESLLDYAKSKRYPPFAVFYFLYEKSKLINDPKIRLEHAKVLPVDLRVKLLGKTAKREIIKLVDFFKTKIDKSSK